MRVQLCDIVGCALDVGNLQYGDEGMPVSEIGLTSAGALREQLTVRASGRLCPRHPQEGPAPPAHARQEPEQRPRRPATVAHRRHPLRSRVLPVVLRDETVAPYVKTLVHLRDQLGYLNDAAVADRVLDELPTDKLADSIGFVEGGPHRSRATTREFDNCGSDSRP